MTVSAPKLTHVDQGGELKMIDVGGKAATDRDAKVLGEIRMAPETVQLIRGNQVTKGNVLEVAKLAGIMAAKRTGELIPLCHPLNLSAVEVAFTVGENRIEVETRARVKDRTGVEMEAMTAAAVALLTIYDMCKAVDRGMVIGQVRLMEKRGGRSGTYSRLE